MTRKLILLIALCLAGVGPARYTAAEEIPESYVPVRPYGMGGAWTAIANDENAVWTNPAGIARIRKARSRKTVNLIKVPNLIVGANSKSKGFIEAVSDGTGTSSLEEVASKADDLGDKPFWAFAGAFPLIMFDMEDLPSVVGAYSGNTISSVLNSNDKSLANTEAISDVGGVYGLAFTDRSNRINFGIVTRYVARFAYEDKIPILEFSNVQVLQQRLKSQSNKSTALAVDLGFMWTFADFWFPTFGLAVLNAPTGCRSDYLNPFSKTRQTVCGTVFKGSFSNPEAISTVDPTDIRYGFSLTPRFSNKLGARVAVDMHHVAFVSGSKVYGLDGIDPIKLLHAGVEIFTGNPLLPAPFSVSVGLNQGYYTMGASVRLPYFALDFSSFGRDISADSSPVEDRRYMGGLSVDF